MLRSLLVFFTLLNLAGCASSPEKDDWGSEATRSNPTTSQAVPQATDQKLVRAQENAVISKPRFPHSLTPAPIKDDLWQQLRDGFELPELDNDRVAYYEKRFTRHPEYFYTMLERAKWFLPHILEEVEKRNFPTELALLPAVESAFITDAKSHSSASGLWQFIPSTGRMYKLNQNWWYDGRRDPVKSTQAALKFLGELEQRFDGDWFHAIAAYNAGGITLERAISARKRKGKSTHFNHLKLRRETRDYVPKLIAFRNIFLHPERYQLTLPELTTTPRFASIDAGSQIDLQLFADITGIDRGTLRFLNSAYLRNVTPPSGPHIIHVPAKKRQYAATKLAALSINDRMRWAHYRVKKGDVLGSIARKHHVSVAAIKQSNKLKSNMIHPGKILLIPVSGGAVPTQLVASSTQKKTRGKLTHKVRRGDTLWDIAQRYGVKVAQISRWNQISRSRTLHLGQQLTIYPSS